MGYGYGILKLCVCGGAICNSLRRGRDPQGIGGLRRGAGTPPIYIHAHIASCDAAFCGMDCPGREGRVRPASYELRAARYHRPRESQECRRAGEEISAQGESRCAHSCGRGQPCSLHAGPRKQSSLFHRAQSRNTAVAAINAAHGQLRGERREESACVPRDTAHAHSRNALCVGTTPLAGHRYHKQSARPRVSRQGMFRTDTKR